MDRRQKILVVEDEEPARLIYAAILKRLGVRVETCGSMKAAFEAIDSLRFDLALIDIMLAGPHDRANRDGIEVLKRIKAGREGTKTLVLSGQSDTDLVAEILGKHGADGYISKERAERESPYFLTAIKEALGASFPPPQGREWNSLASALAPDATEAGLVHEILEDTTFSGGLPVLRDLLIDGCKWLVPLVPPLEGSGRGLRRVSPGCFAGLYWSKGQGSAVRIVVHGSNSEVPEDLGSEPGSALHERSKGGLTVAVFEQAGHRRAEFGGG